MHDNGMHVRLRISLVVRRADIGITDVSVLTNESLDIATNRHRRHAAVRDEPEVRDAPKRPRMKDAADEPSSKRLREAEAMLEAERRRSARLLEELQLLRAQVAQHGVMPLSM